MKSTFGLLSAAKAWPPKSAEIAKSVRTDFTSLILPRPARHVLARLSAQGEQTGTGSQCGAAVSAADQVNNRHNGFEAIVLDLTRDLPASFGSNYSEFPNSCRFGQFSLGIDALEMLIHHRHGHLKQHRHQRLGEPERLAFKTALNTRLPVLGLAEDEG